METKSKFHWNRVLAYVVLVFIRYYLFGQIWTPIWSVPKSNNSSSPPFNDKLIYSYFLETAMWQFYHDSRVQCITLHQGERISCCQSSNIIFLFMQYELPCEMQTISRRFISIRWYIDLFFFPEKSLRNSIINPNDVEIISYICYHHQPHRCWNC
jgi:hypothetical protein